ncbi:P-loop ATPase, Sll1717 family [Pseudonocardia xinjiangensis]|uniref:ATP-binding protein n=1 Tax=Pseudonocardia xinjiangensis TaxID=75289 RepID=A0ABX1RPV2_9PSEU|nr:AAA family ATPase [Pseudonocardia xinjiangensis]NMH82412.1 ATP-binding protein [Pseudonocardia xinjiangensis]
MGTVAAQDKNTIDLGAPAAERDIDRGLEHYFLESDAFRRVLRGETTVILGNRGAGKSAIFQIVARRSRANGARVIELAPEDYSYEMLQRTMQTEEQGSWAKQGAYAAAWKYTLLVLVMKELCKKQVRSKNASEAAIRKYVRDHHRQPGMGKLWALISYLKRLEGFKIGPYEAQVKTKELERLYKLEEIRHLVPHLQKALTDQQVVVVIDELDKGWDSSEDAQAFISGLFQACVALNGLSANLRMYISLRQELYENTPSLYEDAQKHRDLIESVSWSEADLRSLIARRIRYSLPRLAEATDEKCWNALFAAGRGTRRDDAFRYIVDRTLHRPREMILFCTQCLHTAGERRSPLPLRMDTIALAEFEYSRGRTHDVAAEQRFQYPDVLSVFEAFRGQVHTFERRSLEYLCLEIITGEVTVGARARRWLADYDEDTLIDVLWKIGFLTAEVAAGTACTDGPLTFVGHHQAPQLDVRNVRRFAIHPMFRACLGTREVDADIPCRRHGG